MAKNKIPEKYQRWIDARKRYHLSHAHIQMARELGLNPKKFGSLANTKQEPWKLPLPEYIEELYFKRFKKERPDSIRSIEQMMADRERNQADRKERRRQQRDEAHPENAIEPSALPESDEVTGDIIPF